jgi:hypothetical protein
MTERFGAQAADAKMHGRLRMARITRYPVPWTACPHPDSCARLRGQILRVERLQHFLVLRQQVFQQQAGMVEIPAGRRRFHLFADIGEGGRADVGAARLFDNLWEK